MKPRLAALLIFLATWAVYLNSLGGSFLFDDTSIIQNNAQIRGLGISNLKQIFGSHYWQTVAGHGGLYRPLVVLSYALNYAIGKLEPWSYHFVNVLLHAVNSVLVFLIVDELFRNRTFAVWSGLLFGLHPIRTEAVAYVAGRAETLAALFFLAAWWCYLKGKWALAGVFFFLAALSKESALVFVAVPLLSDLVAKKRPVLPGHASVAAAAVLALAARYVVLGGFAPLAITASSNPLVNVSAASRLMTAAVVLGRYLWLLVFPIPLSADYSFNQIPPVASPAEPEFWISTVIVVALLLLVARDFSRSRGWFFCGAFFLLTFSLTSNFIRPIGTIMAERLMYLPSLGFTCAVAYAIARAKRREMATAAAVLLGVFYGVRAIMRNNDWKDHLSLFSSAAVVSPNSSLVQSNLANALLYQRGDAAAAAEHAREAIRIEPGDPAAHMTLAESYQKLGDLRRAAEEYAQVEKLAHGTPGGEEAARRRRRIALPRASEE